MYPTDLDETITEHTTQTDNNSGQEAATTTTTTTIAAATSVPATQTEHHQHHHHRHQQHRDFLQLPDCAKTLSDNCLARDNISICPGIADNKTVSNYGKMHCCFCCGTKVNTKKAVYLAATIGFALNFFGLFFYVAHGQFGYSLPSLLAILLYTSIFVAQKNQKAALFLPFLGINAFMLLLWLFLCMYLVVLVVALPDWCIQIISEYFEWKEIEHFIDGDSNSNNPATAADEQLYIRAKVRLFLGISLATTMAYMLVECWLWCIILHGYKAAKERRCEEWLQNLNKNIRSISIY